jgi:hypothetical protein
MGLKFCSPTLLAFLGALPFLYVLLNARPEMPALVFFGTVLSKILRVVFSGKLRRKFLRKTPQKVLPVL